MSFKSENEIDRFNFQDCVIAARHKNNTDITYEVDALIVMPENSQNSQFTESYADTARIRFIGGVEVAGVKEGVRKYDANDRLISETPDERLSDADLGYLLNYCKDMYLEGIEEFPDAPGQYVMFLSKAPEEEYDTAPTDSYQIGICCDKIVVEWDRYLNRVQK